MLFRSSRGEAFLKGCYNSRPTVSVVDIFGRAPGLHNVYSLSETPSIRWDRVGSAMNCASCHNNAQRGALNEKTDWSQIDFKILVDQSMPYGLHNNPLDIGDASTPVEDALTGDERIALANCLRAEFQLERKELKQWLTQDSCQE